MKSSNRSLSSSQMDDPKRSPLRLFPVFFRSSAASDCEWSPRHRCSSKYKDRVAHQAQETVRSALESR